MLHLIMTAADAATESSWQALIFPALLVLLNIAQAILQKRTKKEAGTATSIVRLLIRAVESQAVHEQLPATSKRLKTQIANAASMEGLEISKTLHRLVREETPSA